MNIPNELHVCIAKYLNIYESIKYIKIFNLDTDFNWWLLIKEKYPRYYLQGVPIPSGLSPKDMYIFIESGTYSVSSEKYALFYEYLIVNKITNLNNVQLADYVNFMMVLPTVKGINYLRERINPTFAISGFYASIRNMRPDLGKLFYEIAKTATKEDYLRLITRVYNWYDWINYRLLDIPTFDFIHSILKPLTTNTEELGYYILIKKISEINKDLLSHILDQLDMNLYNIEFTFRNKKLARVKYKLLINNVDFITIDMVTCQDVIPFDSDSNIIKRLTDDVKEKVMQWRKQSLVVPVTHYYKIVDVMDFTSIIELQYEYIDSDKLNLLLSKFKI